MGMHLARLGLQTYIANPAQQETNIVHDVENYKANIMEEFRCLFDGRLDQHAQGHCLLHVVIKILIQGWIVLLRMLHFEMALEVIIAFKCAPATINGARIFAINGSIDNNSTSGGTDLTGWLMQQSAMSIMLMRTGKTNVTLEALEVGHEYQLTIYRCLGRHKSCNWQWKVNIPIIRALSNQP